jgi:uncharacterized membrane protein YdbT with pleckstrin-like domain
MSYLQNNLQSGEEVKYIAKIHFFLFVQPLVLLAFGYLLYETRTGVTHYGGLLLLFLGAVSLMQRLLVKLGALYAVTDRRIILKTGIISRQALELVLSKCEGVQVKQGITGRIFNFGTITVTTGGATNSYPFVANPFAFKKEINSQIG